MDPSILDTGDTKHEKVSVEPAPAPAMETFPTVDDVVPVDETPVDPVPVLPVDEGSPVEVPEPEVPEVPVVEEVADAVVRMPRARIEVYESKNGWRWRAKAGNNRVIGKAEEGVTKRSYAIAKAQRQNPDLPVYIKDKDGWLYPLEDYV